MITKAPFASLMPHNVEHWEDRMEVMARHYFCISGEGDHYNEFEKEPYLSAAINGGLNATPLYMEGFFKDEFGNLFNCPNYAFTKVDLPFELSKSNVHQTFHGQIPDCSIPDRVETLNAEIHKRAKGNLIEPPLGRILSVPTRIYMKNMLLHSGVVKAMEEIKK